MRLEYQTSKIMLRRIWKQTDQNLPFDAWLTFFRIEKIEEPKKQTLEESCHEFEMKAEKIFCNKCKISTTFYFLQNDEGSIVCFCHNCETILPILIPQQRRIMK